MQRVLYPHHLVYILTAHLQGKTVLSPVMQMRMKLGGVKEFAWCQLASWEQCGFHLEADYMPKGLCHLLQSAEEAEVGCGARDWGGGSLTYAQSQTELQSSGQERSISSIVGKGEEEVVLLQPLFWARPVSGSLSSFLPDSPPVKHGVASPMSRGIILPQLHMNRDH